MALSLETQEILLAFAPENEANEASWGKYELDELQDAWAELPGEEQITAAGQRIKERMEELESGKDHLHDNEPENLDPLVDTTDEEVMAELEQEPESAPSVPSKPNKSYIIGMIITALVLLVLSVLFIF